MTGRVLGEQVNWVVNGHIHNLTPEFCPLVQFTNTFFAAEGDLDIDEEELRLKGQEWVLAIRKRGTEYETRHRKVLEEGVLHVQSPRNHRDQSVD